ncbi:S8 family peptidase, partial [Streptomyces sp. NPDC006283]
MSELSESMVSVFPLSLNDFSSTGAPLASALPHPASPTPSSTAPDAATTVYTLEDFPNGDSADNVAKTYTVNASSEAAN